MNILYVSAKKGWGGAVTWMYRSALGLQARGHNVWIVSHPASPFTRLSPAGVNIIPRRLGMDLNPAMVLFLVTLIKRRKMDLVLTNIQKEVLAGGVAARLCGIPNVRFVGNELDLNNRIRWRQRLLVDHTIVPSDATLKKARTAASWLAADGFTTIYAGLNPVTVPEAEIAEQRKQWGLSQDALVIGTTARLTEIKGIDGLIRAFGAVAQAHPGAYLVITGEGPEAASLKQLAANLGLSGRVVFAGFSAEPVRAAAAYDIAVLNSTIEGFPYVVVEYMAAGRPVVASNVGGIPEIMRDGENGLLVRPGDDQDLSSKLLTLAGDPALRKRLGKGATDSVAARFSEVIMIDRTEEVFRQVIADKRRHRN